MTTHRLRRPHRLWFYSLGQWGAQLPRPWVQLALAVPVLVIVFSLIDTIRRDELSLNPGHPMLALPYAALGAVLTHCVLLAMASKETIGAFLFIVCTALQCVRLLLYCSFAPADLAVVVETHWQSLGLSVATCCLFLLGGSQGCYPFPDQVRLMCTCVHMHYACARTCTCTLHTALHTARAGALR